MGIFSKWMQRSALTSGARSAYALLVKQDKRTLMAQFDSRGGRITMLAGRGERAEDVAELASMKALQEYADYLPPQAVGSEVEIDPEHRKNLEWMANQAMKHMNTFSTKIMLVSFPCESDPEKDFAAVFTRGETSIRLTNAARELELVDQE